MNKWKAACITWMKLISITGALAYTAYTFWYLAGLALISKIYYGCFLAAVLALTFSVASAIYIGIMVGLLVVDLMDGVESGSARQCPA